MCKSHLLQTISTTIYLRVYCSVFIYIDLTQDTEYNLCSMYQDIVYVIYFLVIVYVNLVQCQLLATTVLKFQVSRFTNYLNYDPRKLFSFYAV